MKFLRTGAASLLIILFISASALISVPLSAHADALGIAPQPVIPVANASAPDLLDFAKNALTSAYTWLTSGSVAQLVIKEYTLDPIVRSLAQAALQSLVGSVVNFVNGKGSGGSPLFVQNLSQLLLQIGDKSALNFFSEILKSSNSPFAAVLTSTLQNNYLQSTSVSGFWAANQCTLTQASPNIQSFLAGNFTQGGFPAWFSLTTQPQNNPYTEYYTLQAEQQGRVAGVQNQELTRLGWGQGILSWCGANSSSGVQPVTVTPAVAPPTAPNAPVQSVVVTPAVAAPPLDNCTQSNGQPGTTQTPGSVIHDQLSTALGSQVGSLLSAHEIDEMISSIFSSLITSVLGGTGLAGASSATAATPSLAQQLQTPAATPTTALGASSAVSTILTQVATFSTSWQTIQSAAQTASTDLNALANSCVAEASTAQNALATEVTPVLSTASSALSLAQQTTAFAQKVSAESNSGSTAYATDLQTLASLPPTAADIANAQNNAQTTNAATAVGTTSLTVAGGTTLDQMNLIAANAAAAQAACTGP